MGNIISGKGGGSAQPVMGRVAMGRKVEPGDVLVAKMTDPAMFADMQRAIAVVTDEGGAFCHAAIVCNQMGTPFVVGTKVATTTLKDGMFVKVDPAKGTVEVLG